MPLRQKLDCLRLIGFTKMLDDKWFNRLEASINRFDDELRNERNRLIHDVWINFPDDHGASKLHRVQIAPRLKKKPEAGTRELHMTSSKPVTAEDISALCDRVIAEHVTMRRLRREYELAPLRCKPA